MRFQKHLQLDPYSTLLRSANVKPQSGKHHLGSDPEEDKMLGGMDGKQLVSSPTMASVNFFPPPTSHPGLLLHHPGVGATDHQHPLLASNLFYQALAKGLTPPQHQQPFPSAVVHPFAQASTVDAGQVAVMGHLLHRLFLLQRFQQQQLHHHRLQQMEQRVSPVMAGPNSNGSFTITSLLSPTKEGVGGMTQQPLMVAGDVGVGRG